MSKANEGDLMDLITMHALQNKHFEEKEIWKLFHDIC